MRKFAHDKQSITMSGKKKIYINRNNSDQWKEDTCRSVEMYNEWFLGFAPATYISEREKAKRQVANTMKLTNNFHLNKENLLAHPGTISILRMVTAPPIARDRLAGLSGVGKSVISRMENGKLPTKMTEAAIKVEIGKIAKVLNRLFDRTLCPWIDESNNPTPSKLRIAASVVADRMCGMMSDPIIRNEQERRQLRAISSWLAHRGYKFLKSDNIADFRDMALGTYTYHLNVAVENPTANMPIDVVIRRKDENYRLPLLVECKSAGDFTNTNKRRKEEAQKITQLRATYGDDIDFVLFLCGYFDSGYLGYEASEKIDWIWEHRIDDFSKAGV